MKGKEKIKQAKRLRRKARVRAKIKGTTQRPRFCVSRSLKHLYVQIIDDTKGQTLVSVKDSEIKGKEKNKTDLAFEVGQQAAKKALAKKIDSVVFDKGACKYHGRIKAAAEGARKGGLQF